MKEDSSGICFVLGSRGERYGHDTPPVCEPSIGTNKNHNLTRATFEEASSGAKTDVVFMVQSQHPQSTHRSIFQSLSAKRHALAFLKLYMIYCLLARLFSLLYLYRDLKKTSNISSENKDRQVLLFMTYQHNLNIPSLLNSIQ